jgi:RNA polymerase sigma-70 factor (ECF subfamily)
VQPDFSVLMFEADHCFTLNWLMETDLKTSDGVVQGKSMSDSHATRPSLLVRMRDTSDRLAWGEFVEIYSPLIYGFGRKHGLQDADAVDVTQEVLRVISKSIGRFDYDANRGSFRGWLFTIVRNELKDWRAKQRSALVGSGDASMTEKFDALTVSEEDDSRLWEREHQRRRFEWAAERVRSEVRDATWKAFWQTTVEHQCGQQVATELGLSVAAVYLAKGRVMSRLKELIRLVE